MGRNVFCVDELSPIQVHSKLKFSPNYWLYLPRFQIATETLSLIICEIELKISTVGMSFAENLLLISPTPPEIFAQNLT